VTRTRPRLKWSARDVALVRRHRGPGAPEPLPFRELARRLGGAWTPRRARRLARHLGLCRPRPPRWTPDRDAALRRLHAAGLCDRRVARALGVTRDAVKNRRRLLGLPAVGGPPGSPAGPRSGRSVGARLAALRLGRPGLDSPAEAAVLDVLWRLGCRAPSGPFLSGRRLAFALGVGWGRGSRLRRRLARMAAAAALEVRRRGRRLAVRAVGAGRAGGC
jgi:hypothetical protein